MAKKEHLNYFGDGEKGSINSLKDGRTSFLTPVVKFLVGMHVTANMVSYFGFLLVFGFIYFFNKNWIAASLFLLFHVLIDGLDGPIARYTKTASDSGAFTDIVCDTVGIIIVTGVLVYYGPVDGLVGLVYSSLYLILIIFAVSRNILKIPAKFVFRSKYYIYLLYLPWAIYRINYFNLAMIIFSAIMFISVIHDFFRIKKILK